MTPGRLSSQASSLQFPLMALLFTWYHHEMLCQHKSLRREFRFLYQGKNFSPVRNLATVSCKRETTTHFGVKSVCWQTGTGSTCVMFAILNHMCILSAWNVPYQDMKWPSHHVNAIRNQKVIPVWNLCGHEFSHVNTPLANEMLDKWSKQCPKNKSLHHRWN